jgi:hypothetical protein
MPENTSAVLAVSSNKAVGARPNTSGFPGVAFHKSSGRWTAYVTLSNGKRKHVAIKPTLEAEAAAVATGGGE